MKKKFALFLLLWSMTSVNGQYKTCVRMINTNQWGSGIIKRCCCGCQLMYMASYSASGSCRPH